MNLLGIFAIFSIGLGFIYILEKVTKHEIPNWLGLGGAYPIGAIFVAAYFYGASLLSIPWSQFLSLLILLPSLYLSFLWIRSKKKTFHKKDTKNIAIQAALMLGIWYLLSATQLSHQLIHSDGLNYWFLRATIFFEDRGVKLESLKHLPFNQAVDNPSGENLPAYDFLPLQYPLLVPLVIDYTYNLYGQIAVIPAKYLWLGVEWSIIILLYGISRRHGLLGVILFYLIPATVLRFSVHNFGFVDIWVGLFWLFTILSLYLGLKDRQTIYYYLSLIGICGLLMTKIEGVAGLWLLPLFIAKFKHKPSQWWVFLSLLFAASWYFVARDLDSSGFISHTFTKMLSGKLDFGTWPLLITSFIKELATISTYGLVWWIFFPTLWLYIRAKSSSKALIWLWLSICIGIGLNLFEFLTLQLEIQYVPMVEQIPLTMPRYANHWYPTVVAFLMVAYDDLTNNKSKKVKP